MVLIVFSTYFRSIHPDPIYTYIHLIICAFQSFFSAYKVAPDGVTIMMDYSGRPSGQALVVFETPEDAQEALKLDKEKIGACIVLHRVVGGCEPHISQPHPNHLDTNLGGRWIDLFQASMQEVQTIKARGGRAVPAGAPYGGGGGGSFGGFRGQHPVGGTSMPGAAGPVTFPFVAKVRGLPFDCARSDLVTFFASAGVKENGIFFVSCCVGRWGRWRRRKGLWLVFLCLKWAQNTK